MDREDVSVNLHDQWVTVGYMLIAGIALGIAYDACRVLEAQWRIVRTFAWLLDCLYWTSATVIVFQLLVRANDGQLRIYVPLFLLIGGVLYFRVFSSRMRRFMLFLILPIKKICTLFIHICIRLIAVILWPLKWLLLKPMQLLYRVIIRMLAKRWSNRCGPENETKPKK